jgi:hypothetical protein
MSTLSYALRQVINLVILAGYLLGGSVVGSIVGALFGMTQKDPHEAVATSSHVLVFCIIVAAALAIRRLWLTDSTTKR